jgi:hypothetical protein
VIKQPSRYTDCSGLFQTGFKNKMADNHVSMAVLFDVPDGIEFK